MGAIAGGALRDVHVAVRAPEGGTRRHLFADTLELAWMDRGVQLVLEDGVTMRGDSRAPFLNGRYRIFLPRADGERWAEERLPGLAAETSADFFHPSEDG